MKPKKAEETARRHFHSKIRSAIDLDSLKPSVETLNAMMVFAKRIEFVSIRRRGAIVIATTKQGEIIWPTTADLGNFPKSQAIIADATNVFLMTPPHGLVRHSWDMAASLILKLAATDTRTLDHPLKEEVRELLKMVWYGAEQPQAFDAEGFVNIMGAIRGARRDPNGSTPPCVFLAEGHCWVHMPTLRNTLSLVRYTNKLYALQDVRTGLILLSFENVENLTRGHDGKSRSLCLWQGPVEILVER